MSDAWDVFTASLDPAELEQERCLKSGNREATLEQLRSERFGTRRHGHMVFMHEVRGRAFRVGVDREASRVREVFRFSDRELEIALAVMEKEAA